MRMEFHGSSTQLLVANVPINSYLVRKFCESTKFSHLFAKTAGLEILVFASES